MEGTTMKDLSVAALASAIFRVSMLLQFVSSAVSACVYGPAAGKTSKPRTLLRVQQTKIEFVQSRGAGDSRGRL